MECIHNKEKSLYANTRFYKLLDKQYPNSKFILNTRNKQKWLKSRINHQNGQYLSHLAKEFQLSENEMIQKWSDEWDYHHLEVISYFYEKPNKLIIFDIEKDNPVKLEKFFKNNFNLNTKFYGHYGKT